MRGATAVLISLVLLGGCTGGGRPPVVVPTPPPTPVPTPPIVIPTPEPPKPTPTPPAFVCEDVSDFKGDLRKPPTVARYIVSWTPGSGGVGRNFKPLGPECNPTLEDCSASQREVCEKKAGPYKSSLGAFVGTGFQGVACNGLACNQGGNCFPLNDNPLMVVVCIDANRPSATLRIEAANGVSKTIEVN